MERKKNPAEGSFGRRLRMTAAVAVLIGAGGAAGGAYAQNAGVKKGDAQVTVTASKFYCNVGALSAAEGGRHKELTDKLMRLRKEVVEHEKGYEFQYRPEEVSVAEVAEWVVAESKCCPFFDFHIDLEEQGRLVCLRLTGAEGVKAFIRSELGVEKK